MDQIDINTLEAMASKYKIRYDVMDVEFGQKVEGTNVYVAINLTNVLTDFSMFKESLVDVKGFEEHASISLLNLIAHYKHFFQLKNANHIICIAFVKDNYIYNKNKEIMDQLVDYSSFFKNVYVIPKILNDNRLYMHVVCATMTHMKNVALGTNQSSIFLVSNAQIDRQIMCLFPTRCAYTLMKDYKQQPLLVDKTRYMHYVMKKDMYYDGSPFKAQLECMNVLLGRWFGTLKAVLKKVRKSDDYACKYLHMKTAEKINVLSNFLTGAYDADSVQSVSTQFVRYLSGSGEFLDKTTLDSFAYFEKLYDFRYQNIGELNRMIIPLLATWQRKIKDYDLVRESENYKALIAHPLFSNWL